MKNRLFAAIAASFVLLVGAFMVFWGLTSKGYILDDTKYARDYTHAAFDKITVGMSRPDVQRALGKPLCLERLDSSGAVGGYVDAVELWRYSRAGTFGWRHREVGFDAKGLVLYKERRWE